MITKYLPIFYEASLKSLRSKNEEISLPKRWTFIRSCFLSQWRQVIPTETPWRHFCITTEHISIHKDAYLAQRIPDASSKLRFYPLLYTFWSVLCRMCFTRKCKKSAAGIAAFENASFHSPPGISVKCCHYASKHFHVKHRLFPSLFQRQRTGAVTSTTEGAAAFFVVRPRNPLENVPKRTSIRTAACNE